MQYHQFVLLKITYYIFQFILIIVSVLKTCNNLNTLKNHNKIIPGFLDELNCELIVYLFIYAEIISNVIGSNLKSLQNKISFILDLVCILLISLLFYRYLTHPLTQEDLVITQYSLFIRGIILFLRFLNLLHQFH